MCTVLVNGRTQTACTHKAAAGQEVDVDTPELNAMRRTLVQMLFIEGNHFCPGCEKSGACQLQALGYEYEMMSPHFVELYPARRVDASHPDVMIEFNRCVLCELCVRASRDVDHKEVFAIAGRGQDARLIINSPTGKLGDSALAVTDRAVQVCPVGAIIVKRVGFSAAPIGERLYDNNPISAEVESCEIPETR
jgi:[NiFe] hydrogenase diaphorase moiety small subunit